MAGTRSHVFTDAQKRVTSSTLRLPKAASLFYKPRQ